MVETDYSGSADLFTKRLVVSLCTLFPDLKKDGLMLLTWFSDFCFED